MERNRLVADLTIGELLDIMDERYGRAVVSGNKVKGVKGLADYLQCSLRTAQKLKSSGRIDSAITQTERTIVIDTSRLDKLLRKS